MHARVTPSRLASVALLAAALAACGDQPLDPSTALSDVSASAVAEAQGPAQGFPVVFLDERKGGNGPNATSFDEAMAKVGDGGTIKVSPGTWDVGEVVMDKSVTVEGQGEGAVLHLLPGAYANLTVTGATTAVAFRDLDIDGGDADGVLALRGLGDFASLTLENVHYTGSPDVWAYGLGLYGSGEPRQVSVTGSSFTDCGYYCVWATGPGMEIEVDDVEATTCGIFSCVGIESGAVGRVANGRFSNPHPTPVPFRHHVLIAFDRAEATFVDNVIDGCGEGQCITVAQSSSASVTGNEINAYEGQGTRFGIIVGDGAGGGSGDPARGSEATVTDNVVTGDGPLAYYCAEFDACGPLQVEGFSTAEVSRNVLEDGHTGIVAGFDSHVTGRDNRVSGVQKGLATFEGGVLDLHFSDVTGYSVTAIDDGGASDLTCNWWGDAAGPGAAWAPPSVYTPWATEPVAGTGATDCSGGA